jgi:pimeloyl-ACP methyl ester carboxylesterase
MPSISVAGVNLDYRSIPGDGPVLVFLHEGLGSQGLWRDFPDGVAAATGRPAVIYSRHGHGWSDPITEPRTPHFMHDEALIALPDLLAKLGITDPILVGHSDGASIALIHAGAGRWPVRAIVAIAPHVFVEKEALTGVEAARKAFEEDALAEKMARHHHDAAATFYGWHDHWKNPAFQDWNLEEDLTGIECPLLLIQCAGDEYGTARQLDAVEAAVVGPVEQVWLEDCGHSAHLDQPETVAEAVVGFVRSHT